MIGDLKFRLQSDPNPQRGKKAATAEPAPESPVNEGRGTISSKPTPFVRSIPDAEVPSLEVPVALPDNGQDFAVEPSIAKLPIPAPIPRRKPVRDDSEEDIVPLATDSSI
jgi:hypothetical protein